jgi:hypothetical protein
MENGFKQSKLVTGEKSLYAILKREDEDEKGKE